MEHLICEILEPREEVMGAAYRIYDFHNEQEWLSGVAERASAGSDASAVVGMKTYKTNIELFEEK